MTVWVARLFLLFVAVVACATAGLLLYGQWLQGQRAGQIVIEGGAPHLSAVERVYLQTYLLARIDQLSAPVTAGDASVSLTISPGETANDVANHLVESGTLPETTLFLNYLRYYGLDSQLEAGLYDLRPGLTIPELAQDLVQGNAREIELRFLEGWRLEEMAAYLNATVPGSIDGETFRQLTQRQENLDLRSYAFLRELPPGATLEGYLFPDTYRVASDAEAPVLIDLMLRNFERRVSPQMRQAFAANGLSLHEAVTLASIVERESPLAAERPMIAGVFYNRLNQGMRLQADPTVQYAVGYFPGNQTWWKSPLTASDLEIQSEYNTYLHEGLPPGPIANPGLVSLQAVAEPAETTSLYFVADCNAGGAHVFSDTYDQHLNAVERCRQQ